MPTALQLPSRTSPATEAGPRTFRKQVLPIGRLEVGDRTLQLTPAMLDELVQTFQESAYDMVPLVLADRDNRHTDDPERVRGTVTGLERTDDGLDATIVTTDQGAAILRDSPALPVSARLIPPESEPAPGRWVLAHVCATTDPKVWGTSSGVRIAGSRFPYRRVRSLLNHLCRVWREFRTLFGSHARTAGSPSCGTPTTRTATGAAANADAAVRWTFGEARMSSE